MRTVFIDTFYWVARINPKDQWHQQAIQITATLDPFRGVTTEAVLIEVANYFCALGADAREIAAGIIYDILNHPDIETVPHTRETLFSGLVLYATRLDKSYSLTDCISMNVMRERGLIEVLTHDKHFAQEGFIILL
ncbi:MAG: nucleic acid-binding protein [Bacteroidota bacterium]